MTESDLPKPIKSSKEEQLLEEKTSIEPETEKPTELKKLTELEIKPTKEVDNLQPAIQQKIIDFALQDLQRKRIELEKEIETLEKRKISIENEISKSFQGQSDSIARRVKGFQDYLGGALQDLAQSVEQLNLISKPMVVAPSPLDQKKDQSKEESTQTVPIAAIADTFKPDRDLIVELLSQYLESPDYYADPWKFRRSLEAQDIDLLEDWFFNMGGRGAQPSRGNRSRNVLLSAALIGILGELYGERFQALILASQPERLGEWRRGLQDALGLNREDFGPNSGVVLFERPEPLIERADRLEASNEVPLILIDAAERGIEIPILQFPIWLAFAASPEELYLEEELI